MMNKDQALSIGDILTNSPLQKLVLRAAELQRLNEQIQSLLPETYRGLYRVLNLADNRLLIEVPSAVVRQGLLLQQNEILNVLSKDFPSLNALEFRQNPHFKPM